MRIAVGSCYRCGTETEITLLRRNVKRYGDQEIEQAWCCGKCVSKLGLLGGDLYEDPRSLRPV